MPTKRIPATQDELQSILDDAQSGQQSSSAATPEDDYGRHLDATFDDVQARTQALQQSVAYGVKQNPDQYARLLDLQQRTGVAPQLGKDYEQQLRQQADASGINYPQLVQSNPILARHLSDPNFASVAHDDLDSLSRIEQGAAALKPAESGLGSEAKSALANYNTGVVGFFAPFVNAAGVALQGSGETGKALLNKAAYGDNFDLGQSLRDIWTVPRTFAVQKYVTQPIASYYAAPIKAGPEQYVPDPNTGGLVKNPNYRWWGRPLVNSLEQMPGQLAAMYATGGLSSAAGSAAGVDATSAGVEGIAGATGLEVGEKTLPAILGTQAAQSTYAEARAKGADQKTAILTAIQSGIVNYALMGSMPGGAAPGMRTTTQVSGDVIANTYDLAGGSTLRGALGQWAGRSAGLGTALAVSDNAIARTYDPDRGLLEGLPQSIVSMAAFEGVGAMGHIIDAVEASKLRKRAPEVFQQHIDANFEGRESVRIPAQDFVNYFAGKNLDPAVEANKIGVTNLGEAIEAGSDLEIPTANFFGKLDPEHEKGLLPDIVDPVAGRTSRQEVQYRKELADFATGGGLEKLQAEYEQADAETQATPEWKQVYGDLKQRYVDAGESEIAADSYATLQANAIANLAKGAGLKADELLALHNPKVTAGEAPGEVLHQAAPGDRGKETLDIQAIMDAHTGAKGMNQGAASDALADKVKEALDAGKKVTLYSDGTPVPIVAVNRGMMQDAKGQRWGTMSLFTDSEGTLGNRVEIEQGGLAEEATEQPRGWFRVLPDGRYEIGKTEIGDLSTFIHEPAHAYLELFRELTQREGASDPLKQDFNKICEWLGTTPEEAYKGGFTREQHEKWAKANEDYVEEGRAPSPDLTRAFHNFAVWLGSIYRRVRGLGVELSSDIRGVMDRLYAGDTAIDRAEQEAGHQKLFESPEDAGWTEAEYRNYADAKGLEVDKAREQVRAELNDAAVRERTHAWREEKSNVRDAVTGQVDARPEYAAIRSLRRGRTDLGTDLTLNRGELVRQFGEERVKALQDLHRGLYRSEGGTDAETAAEILGYGSGEEMMRSLESAPRRSRAIEQGVRDTMTARHGDIRYDGSLDDKARLAVENGERAKNLHRELAALKAKVATLEKRAADSKAAMRAIAIAPLEQYQEAAHQIIEQKAIADLQPNRYLNASRKFSREAFDAVRKGNAQAAYEAMNKELLNHFLFREASAARDYADKFESYIKKRALGKGYQQTLGLADRHAIEAGYAGDYRDQFNWLMARYRIGGPNPTRPARSLHEWAEDMYSQAVEPAIPPSMMNEGRAIDYRSAPLAEVRDLHDALINIHHLARMEREALLNGKRLEVEQVAKELDEGIRANMKVTPERVFEKKPGFIAGFAHSIDVQNSRMEFLINKWDGGERGPWRKYLWETYQNAKGDELSMQHEFTQAVNDIVEKEAAKQGLRLTEKVLVDGIPAHEGAMTRKELVSIALNLGNSSNLERVEKTFDRLGWDREAVRRIGGMLKPEEWKFVQGVWEALKPWGERMKALEKRLTGLEPVMVEVKPFKAVLDDGTEMDLAGGYYPVHYDPRFADKGFDEEASLTSRNLMEKGYGRATTSRNYTKERSGFGGPLLFDYERTLTGHIAKVTKDISHREFMLFANRVLLHPRVRQALRETQGPAADQDAMAWVRSTVNDRNGSIDGGPNDIRPFLMKFRSNLVKANLILKASTLVLQGGHVSRLMVFTSPDSYLKAMGQFWAKPIEMTEKIRDLSPNQMRFRGENLDRDYSAMLREVADKKGSVSKAWGRISAAPLMYVDHAISFPFWLSVYNDTLLKNGPEMGELESHKIAMHAADSAVQMGMGTGTTGDLPPIMRSPDLFKQFETTLFGFENLNYNIMRHKVVGDAARSWRAGSYAKAAGGLTFGAAMTFFIPAILSAYVRGNGPKEGENWGLWAAERSLFFGAGTIPLVKDVAALAEYGSDRSMNPIVGLASKVIDDLRKSGHERETDWTAFGIDAFEGLGDLFGVRGTGQLAHMARYAHRWSEGKIENPSIYGAVVGGH